MQSILLLVDSFGIDVMKIKGRECKINLVLTFQNKKVRWKGNLFKPVYCESRSLCNFFTVHIIYSQKERSQTEFIRAKYSFLSTFLYLEFQPRVSHIREIMATKWEFKEREKLGRPLIYLLKNECQFIRSFVALHVTHQKISISETKCWMFLQEAHFNKRKIIKSCRLVVTSMFVPLRVTG